MSKSPEMTVKELAYYLGISTHFVYQMRACGFKMRGRHYHSQTATSAEAVEWVVKNDFVLRDGWGWLGSKPKPKER